ncbi:oligosaccharide flippase family protein [Haloferax sp. YSSS75]|uniref:oligosaccharide flippase family protein n=1 Tax=Haloferax sp. YSSS75 TaxID=3388564 RepID=UPI00398D4D15
MSSSGRSVFSAISSVASANIVTNLVTAVVTPILVRVLGASGYGQYATAMALFGLVQILMSSGVNTGVRKFISESRESADWEADVFSFYFRKSVVLSTIFAVVFFSYPSISDLINTPKLLDAPIFIWLSLMCVAVQLRGFTNRTLLGLKREKIAEPIRIVYSVCFGVLSVFLAKKYGVSGVFMSQVLVSLIVGIISAILISSILDEINIVSISGKLPVSEMTSFNNKSVMYYFFITSLYHVDVLLLQYFRSDTEVGQYKAALFITTLLWVLPTAIQRVMLQSTSDLWDERVGKIESLASKTFKYNTIITVAIALGASLSMPVFVELYFGSQFRPTVVPALILLPGTVGFALARPLMSINQSSGNMDVLIISVLICMITNAALNITLIPELGMTGAAVATSLTYAILPILQIGIARRNGYDPVNRVSHEVLTILMLSLMIYFVGDYSLGITGDGRAATVAVIMSSMAVYILTLVKLDILPIYNIYNGLRKKISQ